MTELPELPFQIEFMKLIKKFINTHYFKPGFTNRFRIKAANEVF